MTRYNWRKHLNLSKLFQKHTKEDNNVMNVEKQAKRDFNQLNDFLEEAYKTASYEFTWHYEGITIKYNNYQNQGLSVDLGSTNQFNGLSIGEVELVLRSLLMIYDLNNRGLIKVIKINTWPKTTMQYNTIHAYLKDWREYNENDSFNWLGDRTIEDINVNGVINCLVITLRHVTYPEGKYWTRKAMEEDNIVETEDGMVEVGNISEFYDKWFAAHQGFVSDDTGYEIKFVKDNIKYLTINAFFGPEKGEKNIRVYLYNSLDFNVTPNEFRKLSFMLSVLYDWQYKPFARHVFTYGVPVIKFLKNVSGRLLVKDYRQAFNSYYDSAKVESDPSVEDEARWLAGLADALDNLAYQLYIGQHDSESNSDNYYTDGNGQDMFAKFEALDDFREQTYALGFCYHNIEKYLVRAGRKTDDPTEDINKALDYLHEYRKLQKIYFE